MEEVKKITCPLCGSKEYVEAKLDENVKDAFLEAILGDVPFTRIYDVLGGKISITVAALCDEDNRIRSSFYIKLFDATEKCPDLKAYVPLIESALDIDSQVTKVVITLSNGDQRTVSRSPNSGIMHVMNMDWGSVTNENCKELVDDALRVFEDNMFPGCAIPSAILRGAVGKHNTVLSRLLKECLDENFISGTGR